MLPHAGIYENPLTKEGFRIICGKFLLIPFNISIAFPL